MTTPDPRALAPCDDCGVPAGRACVPTCPTRREPDAPPVAAARVDRARSLTEACELINGIARGTMGEHPDSDAHVADAAAFLRSRLAAWEPCFIDSNTVRWGVCGEAADAVAFRTYDAAMRSLCEAAVALYDATQEVPE